MQKFQHSTIKNEYSIELTQSQSSLKLHVQEKYSLSYWQGQFTADNLKDITFKTGHELSFEDFINLIIKAFQLKDIGVTYVDILTSQDLENLKAKRTNNNQPNNNNPPSKSSKSNKRYIILTYMTNQNKFHYPLSLPMINKQSTADMQQLKKIYNQLRVQLESLRIAALNETKTKNQNSFSIEYDKKNSKNVNRTKEVDQIKSENQILKAKLYRLEQQAMKKKANIQIEAAIQRTKQLKQRLQTQNLQLVDWKNNITDQENKQVDLKKQMQQLHKKICKLLTTEKQVVAKKKGQQTQKQLNMIKNNIKKNATELQKLKKELETSKQRCKQFEAKAKKLTSQKNVIQKGSRRGPYSSAGSVRSYNSFGSKKSYSSNNSYNSSNSKPKSNYSYNSNRFR